MGPAGVIAHSSPSELGLKIYSCSFSFLRKPTFVNALPVDGLQPFLDKVAGHIDSDFSSLLVSQGSELLARYLDRTVMLYVFFLVSDWAYRVRLVTH